MGGRRDFPRDAGPVLRAAVLERDLHLLVVLQVLEFLRVDVGEEEEIRAVAFGDGHGAGDGADAGSDGGQHAGFEGVDGLVEVLGLLGFRGGVVILFGDRGVGLGVDFGLGEGFGHFGGFWGFGVLKGQIYRD